MNRMQEQVRQFLRDVVRAPVSPASPELRDAELRARLILEEAVETAVGLVGGQRAGDLVAEFGMKTGWDPPDLVEAVDGLCDLVYVALGTAEAIGIDLEPFWDLVHGANMAKTGEAVDGHGKRGGKPPGWRDPKWGISALLEAHRRAGLGVGE